MWGPPDWIERGDRHPPPDWGSEHPFLDSQFERSTAELWPRRGNQGPRRISHDTLSAATGKPVIIYSTLMTGNRPELFGFCRRFGTANRTLPAQRTAHPEGVDHAPILAQGGRIDIDRLGIVYFPSDGAGSPSVWTS